MTALGILWFCLIFVLIAGYFVLDGFDLGAGVLSPFVAKNDRERAIVRRSIGPVWDGNEVWLLTAGGALFAAFAPAYATTFSGFYLAIMLVLMGLIVRAVSLEYRAHDPKWGKAWDVLFFVGSLLPALLTGVAVGNIYAGIPLDANGDYVGVPLLGLVTPFTLLCGLLGLSVFVTQGATWLSLKAPKDSDLRSRAAALRLPLGVVSLVLFALVSVWGHFFIQPEMAPELGILRWLFAILFVAAIVGMVLVARKSGSCEGGSGDPATSGDRATSGDPTKSGDLTAFLCSSASAVVLVGLLAASMFPNLVVNTMGENITVATAASSDLSLAWMTGITCVGLPLVLVYHVVIYRTYRGRVTEQEAETY